MAPPPQIRLAVLLCDTPLPQVVAEEGDYHKIYTTLMHDASPGVDFKFVIDAYDVKNKFEYPADDHEYDGIILTGSASTAHDDLEWINKLIAYTAKVAREKPNVKLFGVCFGHQIIARALGGECVSNAGIWEVGITEVALNDLGQQIFEQPILNIQQMHRDHVPAVPSEFKLIGSTPVSMNQGMVKFTPGPSGQLASLTDIQILTVQGHPEFTKNIVRKMINVRAASGVIPLEVAEDARRRSEWRNDGVDVIGRAFWKILGVDFSVLS